jgi:hypothetical protein
MPSRILEFRSRSMRVCQPSAGRRLLPLSTAASSRLQGRRAQSVYSASCRCIRAAHPPQGFRIAQPSTALDRHRYLATQSTTMATSSTVKLVTSEPPSFYKSPLSQEFANKTSQLLQENHEKHHIFFNDDGFHVCFPSVNSEYRLHERLTLMTEPHRPSPPHHLRSRRQRSRPAARLRQQRNLPASKP